MGGVSRQDTPEACSRIAEGYQNQAKSPLGDWIGGAVGRIDGADAALPGGLHVDAVGEPVSLHLSNDLEVRGDVHDVGADHRGAVGHYDAVDVADMFHQLPDSVGVLIRAERDTSLQM